MTSHLPAEGDLAPDFTLPDQDGNPVTLSALRPAPVVLFFYPKDMTPGCTTEGQDFSRLAPEFEALGVRVFGISRDAPEVHRRFREKAGIRVPLLSDIDGEVVKAWGVWKEKTLYGRRHWGIERTTALIDGDGRIARLWRRVKVPGHAEEVLAAARTLVEGGQDGNAV